jgi:hypothetical protein
MAELLFEVLTPVGVFVRCSRAYWEFIVGRKHPVLSGCEGEVRRVLQEPDEVRRSRRDTKVLLFYRRLESRWLCAAIRREDDSGFLVTAYPTDAIKAGETIWRRSR